MHAVTTLVGNPKPRSRTRVIAERIASSVAASTALEIGDTIDLADHNERLFHWPEPTLDALSARVAASPLVIVACPTYKGSYTGLLKAFLDRFPADALSGVVAVALMTSSSAEHALAVEFTLRPLLVELGATVPARGLNVPMDDLGRLDARVGTWLEHSVPHLTAAIQLPVSA